ncbi:MAG TPA: nucleoside-diphosphate kinase [Fibrobacteraceae bacterium]|nr:nucleoside-diphosphate kinase [Fibrobacteraceae bacterium]
MVKPNGVKAGLIGRVLERYEMARLSVCGIKIKHMTRADVEGFYAEHVQKPFFQELAQFMTSGPTILLALGGENAVTKVRALNGATNPAKADPGTIRHDFASTITENVVHASDSVESAAREVSFWFKKEELVSYPAPDFRAGAK